MAFCVTYRRRIVRCRSSISAFLNTKYDSILVCWKKTHSLSLSLFVHRRWNTPAYRAFRFKCHLTGHAHSIRSQFRLTIAFTVRLFPNRFALSMMWWHSPPLSSMDTKSVNLHPWLIGMRRDDLSFRHIEDLSFRTGHRTNINSHGKSLTHSTDQALCQRRWRLFSQLRTAMIKINNNKKNL